MLNWLDSFWNSVTGSVGNAVSSAVHWALHAVMSVILSVFKLVGSAWSALVYDVAYFHAEIDAFCKSVLDFGSYILHHVIPSLLKWAQAQLDRLSADLARIYDWAQREVNDLILRIADAVSTVENWANRTIWKPLKDYADQIWADLKLWGYTAWYYITHPDLLAETLIFSIATSLEKHAWELAEKLGEFAVSLVMANLKRFLSLIETIISAVI